MPTTTDYFANEDLVRVMELATAFSATDTSDLDDIVTGVLVDWHDNDVCLQDIACAAAQLVADALNFAAATHGSDAAQLRQDFACHLATTV